MATTQIFNNQTTNGDSLEFIFDTVSPILKVDGAIAIGGDFGGGYIKLKYQAPNGSWYDTGDIWVSNSTIEDVEYSFDGILSPVNLVAKKYKLTLVDSVSANINAWIIK